MGTLCYDLLSMVGQRFWGCLMCDSSGLWRVVLAHELFIIFLSCMTVFAEIVYFTCCTDIVQLCSILPISVWSYKYQGCHWGTTPVLVLCCFNRRFYGL